MTNRYYRILVLDGGDVQPDIVAFLDDAEEKLRQILAPHGWSVTRSEANRDLQDDLVLETHYLSHT